MGSRVRIAAVMRRESADAPHSLATPFTPQRAALIGLGAEHHEPGESSLEELARLVQTAGAIPVLRILQERSRPHAATFLGRGKVKELGKACKEHKISVVIADGELSPAQRGNIEDIVQCGVIDRTQLILDIFARRARSSEGKLQVELAQLRYLLPRLVGFGQVLSRLGGGIGTRGPGETKLETDRRRIHRRLSVVQRQIEHVRRRRAQLRARRTKQQLPTVALVGYTNAGKTTLFNRLTGDHAVASDALFVTLDPLVRRLRLSDRRMVLCSDTVGFLDRLPHTLLAAFRATLEEVADADLVVHVCDSSSPFKDEHSKAVQEVLTEIGADTVPCVVVWNKSDLITKEESRRIRLREPGSVCLSAIDAASGPVALRVIEKALKRTAAGFHYCETGRTA